MSEVKCPHCGGAVELSAAFQKEAAGRLRQQLSAEFETQRKAAEKAAEERARTAALVQMEDLQQQLKEQKSALAAAHKQELELRKKQRAVEQREEALQLEVQRAIDAQRQKIAAQAREAALGERMLKEAEQEKTINDLKKQIGDLQRRSEQGSVQLQGEVQEISLDEILRERFRQDRIERVARGRNGADLEHSVLTAGGAVAGLILVESKNTKAWQSKWTGKLRADMLESKASVGIIVSAVLPPEVERFGEVDGVWVCDRTSFVGLVSVLRTGILNVHQTRGLVAGHVNRGEALLDFMAGPVFKGRVNAIVGSFLEMQSSLEREKRSFQKIWAERDQQITSVLHSTSALLGDIRGIGGQAMPEIEALELPA